MQELAFIYQLRHSSRTGYSRVLHLDTEPEPRLPAGSAACHSCIMSWQLGQIGRGAARVAGTPTTVAYGLAEHAYEVVASAEGPVGRGGRSRQIASFGLFHAITGGGEGVRA